MSLDWRLGSVNCKPPFSIFRNVSLACFCLRRYMRIISSQRYLALMDTSKWYQSSLVSCQGPLWSIQSLLHCVEYDQLNLYVSTVHCPANRGNEGTILFGSVLWKPSPCLSNGVIIYFLEITAMFWCQFMAAAMIRFLFYFRFVEHSDL